MRLEWIEDILAVAETGSFQAAAERRLLSQPAFSRRLRAIESALGTELFDRGARPARLRPHVLGQIETLRESAAALRSLGDGLREGERGDRRRLSIASQHAITTARAPELLRQLDPLDVEVHLISANRDDCVTGLLTHAADYALVYDVGAIAPVPARDFLDAAVIGADRLVPVFAADGVATLNAGFASGVLPVVAYPGDVFFGVVLTTVLLPKVRRFCRVETKLRTALTTAALQCALSSIAVAWVPESLAVDSIRRGALADLSGALPTLDMKVMAMRVAGRDSPLAAAWRLLRAGSAADPQGRDAGGVGPRAP